MRYIEFLPPIVGIDGEFNTFRMGLFYVKRLVVGEVVALVNNKERVLLGTATVTQLHFGPLERMLREHAYMNHTQLSNVGDVSPREALGEVIKRFYGPQVALPNKAASVIYLRREK